jgi:oligoendopeptidase F
MEIQTPLLRKDVPQADTWNAESVFPTYQDWEDELKTIQAELPRIAQAQGRLAEGSRMVADALEARDEISRGVAKALMFAHICYQVDKTDPVAGGMPGKAQAVYGQAMAATAFIQPELIAIGQRTLRSWQQSEPRLQIYAHYFDNLFRKQAHVRSPEVEELLGMLAEPFSNLETTYGFLVDADFTFEPAEAQGGQPVAVTQGGFMKAMSSTDRRLRQTTWDSYLDTYLRHKNTLASNLTTSIKANVFQARARRHTNTLEASLFEQNIPVQVFHNLIETFSQNLPTWRRYFAIRRKALGVELLEPYDMWAPLTSHRPQVPFTQAVDWICAGLKPLGEDYVQVVRQGCLEQRWVDHAPNQGKLAGAFSYGSPGTHPFIVMNYTDEIFSLSTLAHELGHSMHSYLTWQNQPIIYSDYSLFVAEVASNFHQAMVRAYLLEHHPERDFQIGVIEEAMANFYRYFLIMPTLARFELETHRRIESGAGLNASEMIDLMADLFAEAFGDTVHVDRPRVGMLWATFGHMYSDYYVYQYATGISGAAALSQRVLSGAPGAADDYRRFLSAGNSLYPLEALKLAGVDMTSPEPVEETFRVLAGLVDRLEKLLGN